MRTSPIVLVPGFWLGAWAWDEVAGTLHAAGHQVTAVTLPGLQSTDDDRSAIRLADHIEAICEVVAAAGAPAVLTVHSGTAVPGYAVTDRIPEQLAAMVYVDCFPMTGPIDPDFTAVELPLRSWKELEEGGDSLQGLTPEQLDTFRRLAVPEPGAALREGHHPTNDARLDVPTTVVCTSIAAERVKGLVTEGHPWIADLAALRDVTYVDLPTSHWPMWSRPQELAAAIHTVALGAGET
ncbi:MAG TPA: alpha/beta hydrolase [Acidimicrobiales bacterium]|nr:alpha/beta hydrolase [Acidimicrobiales bacterium]